MSNMEVSEIIKQSLEKAIANGYKLPKSFKSWHSIKDSRNIGYTPKNSIGSYEYPFMLIIFTHDFAKAFFGKKLQKVYGGLWNTYSENPTTIELYEVPTWQHRLQQMVLEEDPIKYLEQFI